MTTGTVGQSLIQFLWRVLLFSVFSSSPFDVEDFTLSSGNVSKATVLQRRVSVYSQGTPETPTFQDASFFVSAVPKRQEMVFLVKLWEKSRENF